MRLTGEQVAALAHPDTGLAERAKRVLSAVGRGEVFQSSVPRKRDEWQPSDIGEPEPVTSFTMGLRSYKLIRLERRVTEPAVAGGRSVRMWRLTADGEAVLDRMGSVEQPVTVAGRVCTTPEQVAAAADERLYDENKGITDDWRES